MMMSGSVCFDAFVALGMGSSVQRVGYRASTCTKHICPTKSRISVVSACDAVRTCLFRCVCCTRNRVQYATGRDTEHLPMLNTFVQLETAYLLVSSCDAVRFCVLRCVCCTRNGV